MAYTPRTYTPGQSEPYSLSRSKLDLLYECPRCFFLLERLGVKRPSLPGFTLNIAVDELLKKEFDTYRKKAAPHPLMSENAVDAVPYTHKDLDVWRENFTGIRHHDKESNIILFGAVDDIWEKSDGSLIVVDYKATSKKDTPSLTGRWGEQYARQVEVYQWLLEQNGFSVAPEAYFVYVNGRKQEDAFNSTLHFDTIFLKHTGERAWVGERLMEAKEVLEAKDIPEAGELCEHCPYRTRAGEAFKRYVTSTKGKK